MLFEQPIPFAQALASRAAKAALPNDLSSAELLRVSAELGERANMIARATNADFVAEVDDVVRRVMTPRGTEGAAPLGKTYARIQLKEFLRRSGYSPEPGKAGTIEDLGSQQRLNLIIETQVAMAAGYGQWERGNTRAALWQWPAWELVRYEDREEPRDWPARWQDAGGDLYGGEGSGWQLAYADGRMVALKGDSIWADISRFGLPYRPFDFNSGMGLAPVPRDYCVSIGLVSRGQAVPPQARPFARDARIAADLTPALQDALLRSLGPGYEFRDGVLQRTGGSN